MSIVAADIVAYAAVNMPADDVSTLGGAVDLLRRVDFIQMSTSDRVEVLSSNAGDTGQTVTIRGRLTTGAVSQEVVALNGTNVVLSASTYERLVKVELSAACAGSVTVRKQTGDVTIRVIPAGERGFMAIFREVASEPGVVKTWYGKFYWANMHGSLTYLDTFCEQSADGTGLASPDGITHIPAAANNDTATSANRLTAPAGADTLDPDTWDDTAKATGDIPAGAKRGVWLRMRLPAGYTAIKADYTPQIRGGSV